MELPSFIPAVSLAHHPSSMDAESLEVLDLKGLWITCGALCVLPAAELVPAQLTMYTHTHGGT